MKCLLIAPPPLNFDKTLRAYPPMSLLYLTANIKKYGHESIILDLGIKNFSEVENFSDVIIEKIKEIEPQLIGFTCLISSSFPFIMEQSKFIKEKYPNSKIIVGGLHPTLFAKEILAN